MAAVWTVVTVNSGSASASNTPICSTLSVYQLGRRFGWYPGQLVGPQPLDCRGCYQVEVGSVSWGEPAGCRRRRTAESGGGPAQVAGQGGRSDLSGAQRSCALFGGDVVDGRRGAQVAEPRRDAGLCSRLWR